MKAILLAKAGLIDRKEYAIEEGKACLVGRSREADVIVKDRLASRNHCKIAATADDEWTVADLGSSNGTYVNRERITTRVLRPGDVIQIGKAQLEFHIGSVAPARVQGPTKRMETKEPGPPVELVELQPEAPAPAAPPPQSAQAPTERPPTVEPPPAARPAPSQPPKPEGAPVDEDIRGLFDFLDKVGQGGRPPAAQGEPAGTPPEDAGRKPREKPPAAGRPGKEAEGEGLFSLLDDIETPAPGAAEPPPASPETPPAADPGGLLAFLRKKKQ